MNKSSQVSGSESTSQADAMWVEGLVPGIDFCNHGNLYILTDSSMFMICSLLVRSIISGESIFLEATAPTLCFHIIFPSSFHVFVPRYAGLAMHSKSFYVEKINILVEIIDWDLSSVIEGDI